MPVVPAKQKDEVAESFELTISIPASVTVRFQPVSEKGSRCAKNVTQ
jgi:hypothetical protein